MASFLSLDTLSGLSGIFIFLFVWVLVYGILGMIKPFGEKKEGLYAIIALAMGLLVGMNSGAIRVFTFFTSWFSILLILIFFILLAVMLFGVKMEAVAEYIQKGGADGGSGRQIIVWIIIFSIIIMGIGISLNVGQSLLSAQPGQQQVAPQTQGTVQIINPETGMTSEYAYDYRLHRDLGDAQQGVVNPVVTQNAASSSPTNTGDYQTNFVRVIFHPKVLGLALFMLIGLFASLWLTETTKP